MERILLQPSKPPPPSIPPDPRPNTPIIRDDPINCSPPTELEVAAVVHKLKSGKAPGICGITAELLKAGGLVSNLWLTRVFQSAWNAVSVPTDWTRGIILPFYKGKGSRLDCKNYRGITLLSVPGKVFAGVILARIKDHLIKSRRLEQSGYTPGRSTVDRIFTLNSLIQTRREFRQPLWIAYVDLKAAFDSVDRPALWNLLTSLGIPPTIVDLIRELYTNTTSAVRMDGVTSEWFSVESGVHPGCT